MNIKSTATSNVNHPQYKETDALQQLMIAISDCLAEHNELYEQTGSDYLGQVSITVGDKTVGLLLGGPQAAGLSVLIDHISAENGYSVDWDNQTVTSDWL